MWPINYDDINKLHMSLGIGLLVASILLLLSANWTWYEKSNELSRDYQQAMDSIAQYYIPQGISTDALTKLIDANQEQLSTRIEFLETMNTTTTKLSNWTFFVGIALFFLGYVPFCKSEYRRLTKTKKKCK